MKTRFQTYLFIFTILLLTACGQGNQETESNNPPSLSNYNLPANIQKSSSSVASFASINVSTVTEPFNMIISANPKLYSYREGTNCPLNPHETSEDCVRRMSLKSNADQYFAMKSLANTTNAWRWPVSVNLATSLHSVPITKPVGLIINGNLTNYWYDNGRDKNYQTAYITFYDPVDVAYFNNVGTPMFRRVRSTIYANLPENFYPGYINAYSTFDTLGLTGIYNYYPGLGNSDYSDNTLCTNNNSGGYGGYACASKIMPFFRKKLLGIPRYGRFGGADGYDLGSLAYYFDIGNHRFIQLNNYPTYHFTVTSKGYDTLQLQSSITWLKNTLNSSGNKRIVLNMHDYGEHMQMNNPQFLNSIDDAREKIIALFAGNNPQDRGWVANVPCKSGIRSCSEIPVFGSGSADHNTFLVANFASDSMSVGAINSEVWTTPQRVMTVNEIPGTQPENQDMNATYISKRDCNSPLLSDRTYVIFNTKEVTSTGYNIATTHTILFKSFSVEGEGFRSSLPASLTEHRITSRPNVVGTPVMVANNNILYAIWREYDSTTNQNKIFFMGAMCSGITSTSRKFWHPVSELMTIAPGNYDGGLSAIVRNHILYLVYPGFASGNNQYWLKLFGMPRIPIPGFNNRYKDIPAKLVYNIHRSQLTATRPSFWVDSDNSLNLLSLILQSDSQRKNVARHVGVLYNIGDSKGSDGLLSVEHEGYWWVHPVSTGYSNTAYKQNQYTALMSKQYHAIASFPSGKTVSLHNFIGGDIGYEISGLSMTENDVPFYQIVSKSKVFGQLVKKIGNGTIQSRGGIAIARSNDRDKLIAFYRDAQNNDLYASIFLGEPRFMRSRINSVLDATLLKTYYK